MTVLKDSAWRRRFRVNPLADLFPMMTPEELADTAADIKINGLEIPIVVRPVDGDPEVLDGRNRLEALELAGVALREPDVKEVELNDDEARAFIISANIRRRHLTPGEVADLLVKLAKIEVEKETGSREPVSNSGGRGKKSALKEKVHKLNEALPEKVSESTVKRAIAKTKPPPKVTSKAIDEPKEKSSASSPRRRCRTSRSISRRIPASTRSAGYFAAPIPISSSSSRRWRSTTR